MTCTEARHLTVTLVTSTLPEETDGLADLMLHNVPQGVYNLSRSTKQVWTSNFADKAYDKNMQMSEQKNENF